jgi:hypothetical protein
MTNTTDRRTGQPDLRLMRYDRRAPEAPQPPRTPFHLVAALDAADALPPTDIRARWHREIASVAAVLAAGFPHAARRLCARTCGINVRLTRNPCMAGL